MSEFDTGMGTTPGMWEMVSEALDGEKLPESINKAIYALRDGAATVAMGGGWQPIETAPKETMILLAAEFDGPGDWRIKVGYWHEIDREWKIFGASWEPTKWQPLPEPPK